MSRPQATSEVATARILLVDDDERNLLALSETLSPLGDIVRAASGRDALRELLEGDFAVILLDVFMPELDGYETAALIRERPQTAHVPIIFLSAVNKETAHLKRGYEMGAVDYVFKPFDPVILRTKVGVFVDLYRMRHQVEKQARAQSELREAHLREQLERVEAERRLQDSERRQASILGTLPLAVYEATSEKDVLTRKFVGGDLQYFLGEKASDLLKGARRFEEWIYPEDLSKFKAIDPAAGDSVTTEYRFVGPDGTKRHLLDQRIRVDGGSPTKALWAGTILDVTDRKELEARLVHAGKLDALGQLTGGVAHDFNNLLAAILGGINILERRLEPGPTEKRVLEQMRHAANQGTNLVRRMTAFARRQELTPIAVKPSELCDSVAGLVEHAIQGDIALSWKCSDCEMNLYADRSQLELALMNLIINARDAMPEGGEIAVTIEEIASGERDSRFLRIRVRDTGVGMSDSVLQKVTEPFFTTKGTGQGTGLGLSMVAGFVDQSGGEMKIDSAVGKGTTIDLILPATDASIEDGAGAATPELSWFDGKRLALIDDDDGVRVVLSEQLRDVGAVVEEFDSGRCAIEAVRSQPGRFDFFLTDFTMPELNGLETLRELRKIAPGIGAAIMTGNAEDLRLAENQDIPVVRKPIDMRVLAKAGRKVHAGLS